MTTACLSGRVFTRCCGIVALVALLTGAADKAKMPSFDLVEATVERFFQNERDYKPGEIISQSQVRRLLEELRRLGWNVPRQEDIVARVPDDSELLVRELRTRDGRKFARQIARYPQGYDRLDHLSRMPTGKSALRRLVKGPDGYKLLEYMTTAPGGNELGKMLSGSAAGRDFNKPTGRIYLPSGLLTVLRTHYDETWQAVRQAQVKALGL